MIQKIIATKGRNGFEGRDSRERGRLARTRLGMIVAIGLARVGRFTLRLAPEQHLYKIAGETPAAPGWTPGCIISLSGNPCRAAAMAIPIAANLPPGNSHA